ncbi:hypothetical protein [Microbulbifer sp. PSTR4-B]|uniref:hypothetical protein n=1 Tax=Microbulbifer sp. PSTR4-B TaxID=3243396 RepID=UPI00403944BE
MIFPAYMVICADGPGPVIVAVLGPAMDKVVAVIRSRSQYSRSQTLKLAPTVKS